MFKVELMSQIPNEIQDPGMDELLASIREVIEENSAIPVTKEMPTVQQHGDHSLNIDQCTFDAYMIRPETVRKTDEDTSSAEEKNNFLVQDAMDALAERIGLRKSPDTSISLSASEGDGNQSSATAKPVIPATSPPHLMSSGATGVTKDPGIEMMMPSVVKSQTQKNKETVDEAEIGKSPIIGADVERSVELLLRPYIAQWLEDHFHQLFEKILREEVQRVIQSLQR